jgi:DNA repair protein RecN (Recombination protein N)
MLTHLAIDNYALIDHLDIDFYQGFTAITGETGAGKSILLDALDLVLGKRADVQVLLDPKKKCIVEATFSIANYNLRNFFDASELDYDTGCILRREINPNGKSRAFINDTPVILNQLKSLGDLLVDIHAQHATTSLQDPLFQLSVIDSYAGLENDLAAYQHIFNQLRTAGENKKILVEKELKTRATLDYKQFLYEELSSASIQPDELEQLEEKLSLITHAEEIKSTLFQVKALLFEDEVNALGHLSHAESSLSRISSFHPGLILLAERLNSDIIDLKDLCNELSKIDQTVEFNQDQLQTVQNRLDLLYRLEHKHQVNSTRGLLEIIDTLSLELASYSSLENEIRELEAHIKILEEKLSESAAQLSETRRSAFPGLEKEIIDYLHLMGIPDARVEIRQELSPEKSLFGQDNIEFFFNANQGHALKPIAEIASGGELSRVMLSIKSVISDRKLLPTIIFDEIDNGLSGDVAGKVGDVLEAVSRKIQVIAVTHLPQIAGKAKHHYSVFKQTKNNVTFSNIKFLEHHDRLTELAKMIGGRDVTNASLAAARELLN